MKLPDYSQDKINYMTEGALNKNIKGVKAALKLEHLYDSDELHYLKRTLRALRDERTWRRKANGFGT